MVLHFQKTKSRDASSKTGMYLVILFSVVIFSVTIQYTVLNGLMSNYYVKESSCSEDAPLTSLVSQQAQRRRTLHIIHCLSGNKAQFIDGWEWGLKSIIVNAPLDANLHIHILADADATEAVDKKIVESGLLAMQQAWRNGISITLNNVEGMLPKWRHFLKHALTANETADESSQSELDPRVGIGGYFRLFSHEVIIPYASSEQCPLTGGDRIGESCVNRDLEEAVYMDTDVIVMANLNDLMIATQQTLARVKKARLPRPIWIWNGNSGFAVIDLTNYDRMWLLASNTPRVTAAPFKSPNYNLLIPKQKNDQYILQSIETEHPNATAKIAVQWDLHVGHGWRQKPQNLFNSGRDVGFLHFTSPTHFGGNFMDLGGTDKWCKFSNKCNQNDTIPGGDMDMVRRTWGLAEYYAKLRWDWAIYQGGKSRIRLGENGNELKYKKRIVL
jgi:hypothetical protein